MTTGAKIGTMYVAQHISQQPKYKVIFGITISGKFFGLVSTVMSILVVIPIGTLAIFITNDIGNIQISQTSYMTNGGIVSGAAFSPDGSLVMTLTSNGAARILDAGSGKLIRYLEVAGEIVNGVFSPDGMRIVVVQRDGTARVLDAISGFQEANIGDNVVNATFSPNGEQIVVVSRDGSVRTLDSVSGQLISDRQFPRSAAIYAFFGRDNRQVIVVHSRGQIGIFGVGSDQPIDAVAVYDFPDEISTVAISPDRGRLAVAGSDRVAIFDTQSGALATALSGNVGGVASAAFSPDGRLILIVGRSGIAKIWVADSSRSFTLHGKGLSEVVTAAFTADRNVRVILRSGRILTWKLRFAS